MKLLLCWVCSHLYVIARVCARFSAFLGAISESLFICVNLYAFCASLFCFRFAFVNTLFITPRFLWHPDTICTDSLSRSPGSQHLQTLRGSELPRSHRVLANQNRKIAIASDFRVDGAKSAEIPQKEGVFSLGIAARKSLKSLATFHRTLKSQCSIAFSCFRNRCDFWGLRWASQSQNRKKSLRFSVALSSVFLNGCGFFLLTVGSLLLTVELVYLQLTILAFVLTVGAFLLTVRAFLLTILASLLTIGAFWLTVRTVRLIRALRDCKQRSLTVGKKAPTVSRKASPVLNNHICLDVFLFSLFFPVVCTLLVFLRSPPLLFILLRLCLSIYLFISPWVHDHRKLWARV